MYYSHKTILFSLCLITSIFAEPFVNKRDIQQHPWTTIENESKFCLFLPPSPGLDIAITEDFGIPFCTTENLVESPSLFPKVTGYFDRSKYSLNETGCGGQNDNHAEGKPVGSQCKGYNCFVNLIEPDNERYCIRCCQNKKDCNTGRSGFGYLRVIDGEYTLHEETIEFIGENIVSVYEELASLTFNDDDESLTQSTADALSGSMILDDIGSLNNELLVDGHVFTLDQVNEKWNSLIDYLTKNYPAVTYQIEQLKTVASALTSLEQWKAYLYLTSDKINQFQKEQDVINL